MHWTGNGRVSSEQQTTLLRIVEKLNLSMPMKFPFVCYFNTNVFNMSHDDEVWRREGSVLNL